MSLFFEFFMEVIPQHEKTNIIVIYDMKKGRTAEGGAECVQAVGLSLFSQIVMVWLFLPKIVFFYAHVFMHNATYIFQQ